MLYDLFIIIVLTFVPFLELRASIPYGILVLGVNWFLVFIVAVIANAVLGPVVYLFLDTIIHYFCKFKLIDKLWNKYVEKTQHRIQRYVDKYGEFGVALFIGVPLPGSGSYSGAIGSYVLGLDFKKFVVANLIGVLIAGILVTFAVFAGNGFWLSFVKVI